MSGRSLLVTLVVLALPGTGCLATRQFVHLEVEKSEAGTQQQLDAVDQRLDLIEGELGDDKVRLGSLETDVHQARAVIEETAKKVDQTLALVTKPGPKAEGAGRDPSKTVNQTMASKPPEPAASVPQVYHVQFGFGQWQLDHEARLALLKALKRLNADPSLQARLEGHTDSVGSPVRNLELSQRRADEVRRFLVESGVKRNRIEVSAVGEARPTASNRSLEGREQNRRVAVTLATPAR